MAAAVDASSAPAGGDLAVVGRVRKAHGVRGELVVEPLTDAPAVIFTVGRRLFVGNPDGIPYRAGARPAPSALELTVRAATPFKGGLIVGVAEIRDRNEADLWRGRTLLVPVGELPPPAEDEVYFHELPGMRVELRDGSPVGEVAELYDLPHGLVLDVRRAPPGTGTVAVLYRPEMVVEVDTARRVIVIDPPEGLLD
jgi:16S rRNA processing protein RimM